ncbi:MAG: cupin domain-containing protein [Methylococcaceae bacterium]|nr:cupin domain-containing protein [Methylococcaceae bacterium]
MKFNVKNIFSDIPKQIPDELFQTLLSKEGQIKIERIISKGHSTPIKEWYDQIQDEWIILLKGKAKLQLKNNLSLINLNSGDYYFIPAHTKHRVQWTTPNMETIWLAIHIYTNMSTHK